MVDTSKLTQEAPTEPDPREWLNKKLNDINLEKLYCSKNFLKEAGLWEQALSHWTRVQITSEVCWGADLEIQKIDSLENTWLENNDLEKSKLTKKELRRNLQIVAGTRQWCQEQWGHRVDSLYLQKKSELDRASCRLIRISDKDFATELYHRIKAKEVSFEDVARQYGEGPEQLQGGLIPFQPLIRMPFGIGPILERLSPGKITTPLRLRKGFCMIELLKFAPSQLDEGTSHVLLAEQLKLWTSAVVEALDSELCSMKNS